MPAGTEPERPGPQSSGSGRGWWRGLLLVLLLLLAAPPAALWWLSETAAGRALAARRLSAVTLESGLRVEIGAIEGSLLSSARLRGVRLHDLQGPFASAPEVRLDWRPFAFLLRNRLEIDRLAIAELALDRPWSLKPDPEAPLLPDFDIRIRRMEVGRLKLGEAIAGGLDELGLRGAADVRAGRLLLDLAGDARAGDRLLLRLDAEPEADRFDLAARLTAPAQGLVLRLAGLDVPLELRASGAGSWQDWRGQLVVRAGAGARPQRVALLALTARDGRFGAAGPVDLAPILGELPEALRPEIRIEATGRREGDAVIARMFASTAALAIAGGGGVNLETGQLEETSAELRVLKPAALAAGLDARDLRAGVRLSGPLRRPAIAWDASAARVAVPGEAGPLGLEALAARGTAVLGADGRPLAIPFEAAAGRVTGLDPRIAGLLAAPRVSGTLTISGTDLRLPNLRLEAGGISARADAGLRRAGGAWTTDVAAEVPRFALDGVGTAALALAARIRPGPVVSGRAQVRMLALESEAALTLLGGLPRARFDFGYGADGRLRFADGRLESPELALTGAEGSFDPASDRFRLAAGGRVRSYGPFRLAAEGTPDAPAATLRMPSPGLGIGLSDLVARVTPAPGNRFLLAATGASPAGPLDARIAFGLPRGKPLAIEVERLSLAGIGASGTLVRTPAGPFAGGLSISGPGLDGTVAFAAAGAGGRVQQLSAEIAAANARLPLETPVTIQRGRARAIALLEPGRPRLAGQAEASGVRREALLLTSVRAEGRLRDGEGAATASVSGRLARRDPFALRAAARTIAAGFALTLDGNIGRLPLRLARPAEVHRRPGGWELMPARLLLPQGQLDLAGATGARPHVAVAARGIDLAILETLVPGLRLGGTLDGEARFDLGGTLPVGSGSFRIDRLVRTDAAVLLPVDVALAVRGSAEALEAGARITSNGRELGRAIGRIGAGPGASLSDRLRAGPVTGGIRFNGPVETLWALAAVEGQELKGPVALAVDIGGTLGRPILSGLARGRALTYRNIALGTVIDQLGFDGRFAGPSLVVERLSGHVRGGTLAASGRIGFGGGEDAIDLAGELGKARLAATDLTDVTLSGPVRWRGSAARSRLSGRLTVDDARFVLRQLEASDVPLVEVRRADEEPLPPAPARFGADTLELDVRVTAADVIRIEGMGLDSRWRGDVRVTGTAASPRLVGTATIAEGSYDFAGSEFEITQGRITFNGAPLDSSLAIEASTTTGDGVRAFISIGGTARRPEIAFRSSPSLPDDEILARLLFGASVADLSLPEAIQLASAIATLRGGGGGLDPIGRVRRAAGIDRLRIQAEGMTPGMSTTLVIGQRLSRNLYVEFQTDTEGNIVTLVKLALTSALDLLGQIASESRYSSINLRYQRDR